MSLDPETCYRAMASRDRRFEGRFIVGVRTTGVYCRPGCPARTPKRENVQFFACKAAAEEAGLRPCLRCRPDASPGSPAWLGTPAPLARALRLIEGGALDEGGVEALAERLGMGARHLRRLFDRHLGASPVAIAQTARLHFARKLIEETRLPMTEVAHAAGFSSVRRFNDAARAAFRRTPTELRRRAPAGERAEDAIELRLPYRPPLAWDALLAFLAARAVPGVERAERVERVERGTPEGAEGATKGATYARTIAVGSTTGTLSAWNVEAEHHVVLRLKLQGRADLFAIAGRVRALFDLDADPIAIADHLSRDPALERAVRERPGLRVPGAWDGFELAVRAVLGQQVSVRGATTLAGRLVERFGRALPSGAPGLTHLFPTPDALAEADIAAIGLPRARAEAIRAIAEAARSGALERRTAAGLGETVASLVALPGIGAWTAHYVAMRAAREPDAFPAGDLVLRKRLSSEGALISPRELEARSALWRPWRAYAAMHLWFMENTAMRGGEGDAS